METRTLMGNGARGGGGGGGGGGNDSLMEYQLYSTS